MLRGHNARAALRASQEDSEQMINSEIQEDMANPRDTIHREYGYLRQRTGDLWQDMQQNEQGQPLMGGAGGDRVFYRSIERKDKGGVRMC